MNISIVSLVLFAFSGAEGGEGTPDVSPPTTYELMINGESFLVEAGRLIKLQSKLHPGTSYEVAVRVSPVQYLRLNHIRLCHDLRAKVEDNRRAERRSVRLAHPQGCHLLITELGEPLRQEDRETALRMLTEATVQTYRQRHIPDNQMEVSRLEDTSLPAAEARGVQIRYQDAKGIEHRSLIYLLVGKTFTCSCIVEYLQADEGQTLPVVKRLLDSIQPIGPTTASPEPAKKSKE
ncbi:MAG TPA: hypothetical protein PK777_02190 [Thermoguttaceae bacterium]|nr:hypothetical protein [Thermoguttaceae bacterium]